MILQKLLKTIFYRKKDEYASLLKNSSPETYVVGDIHGELELLKSLIKKLPLNQKDHIVFVGDYIDRGPHSKGVVEYIIGLSKQYKITTLRGNHEQEMLDTILEGKSNDWMIKHKGAAMVSSYAPKLVRQIIKDVKKLSEKELRNQKKVKAIFLPVWTKIPETHKKFFLELKPYIVIESYIISHAGIPVGKKIADVKNEREFYYGDILPVLFRWPGPEKLIMGHLPTYKINRKYTGQPYISANGLAFAIDTGVYQIGVMTAMRLSDQKFFQARKPA